MLIDAAAAGRPTPVIVDTDHGLAGAGGSEPHRMSGPTGEMFAVKLQDNPQGNRVLVNDHVSARFGQLVGAPVPTAFVVDVDPAVAATIRYNNGTTPTGGLAHGSLWLVPDVRPVIDHARVRKTQGNLARYARLDILFDVLASSDQQWVVGWKPPFQVFCVDFGHSLSGQPMWDAAALRRHPPPRLLTATSGVVAKPDLLIQVRSKLEDVSDTGIASCVAEVPEVWGVSEDDKVAICRFLRIRTDAMISLLPTA
jgi:hypothetical protein